MKQNITEITSDSNLKKMEVNNCTLIAFITLYTEEVLEVRFEEVSAFTSSLWSSEQDIQGLIMTDESQFLKETTQKLKEDQETDVNLFSFQFIDSFSETVIFEIIAKRINIKDKTYGQ